MCRERIAVTNEQAIGRIVAGLLELPLEFDRSGSMKGGQEEPMDHGMIAGAGRDNRGAGRSGRRLEECSSRSSRVGSCVELSRGNSAGDRGGGTRTHRRVLSRVVNPSAAIVAAIQTSACARLLRGCYAGTCARASRRGIRYSSGKRTNENSREPSSRARRASSTSRACSRRNCSSTGRNSSCISRLMRSTP